MKRPHPFDVVETLTPHEEDPEPQYGNAAYYDWLTATIEAGTRKPVPWTAVHLAVLLDRTIRAHEAEATGGPKCTECIARGEASATASKRPPMRDLLAAHVVMRTLAHPGAICICGHPLGDDPDPAALTARHLDHLAEELARRSANTHDGSEEQA